jgi:hypothetical protein
VATTTAIAPLGGDAGQPFAALPQIPSYADEGGATETDSQNSEVADAERNLIASTEAGFSNSAANLPINIAQPTSLDTSNLGPEALVPTVFESPSDRTEHQLLQPALGNITLDTSAPDENLVSNGFQEVLSSMTGKIGFAAGLDADLKFGPLTLFFGADISSGGYISPSASPADNGYFADQKIGLDVKLLNLPALPLSFQQEGSTDEAGTTTYKLTVGPSVTETVNGVQTPIDAADLTVVGSTVTLGIVKAGYEVNLQKLGQGIIDIYQGISESK